MVAWLWYVFSGTLAALAFVLLGWGLFSDRPRGRRRCPKCWYDMTGIDGLRCCECGREHESEARLHRRRVRKRHVLLAGVLCVAALVPPAYRGYEGGSFWAAMPTTLLIQMRIGQHQTDPFSGARPELVLRRNSMWAWQRRWLSATAVEEVNRLAGLEASREIGSGEGVAVAFEALFLLNDPDSQVVQARVAALLSSEDPDVEIAGTVVVCQHLYVSPSIPEAWGPPLAAIVRRGRMQPTASTMAMFLATPVVANDATTLISRAMTDVATDREVDARVRASVVRNIWSAPGEEARKDAALHDLLRDPEPAVRLAALQALVSRAPVVNEGLRQALTPLLQDADPEIRREVAALLGTPSE